MVMCMEIRKGESRKKFNERFNRQADPNGIKNKISVDDIVQFTWYDVTGTERMETEEILDDPEPQPTFCWGKVVRIAPRYVWIVSEENLETDGNYCEALPYAMIVEVKVLGHHHNPHEDEELEHEHRHHRRGD